MKLKQALKARQYDPNQIKIGVKIEKEHTEDPKEAKKIAKDHLNEDPKYYDKLLIMEGKTKHSAIHKKILEWFRKNPNPSDKKVHQFANKNDIDEHKFEEIIYQLVTEYAQMIKED